MPVIIYMFTFFTDAMPHDLHWRAIHWHLVAEKNTNGVIEFNWAVMSNEFSMVLYSSYSKQKTDWAFLNLGMTSQGINPSAKMDHSNVLCRDLYRRDLLWSFFSCEICCDTQFCTLTPKTCPTLKTPQHSKSQIFSSPFKLLHSDLRETNMQCSLCWSILLKKPVVQHQVLWISSLKFSQIARPLCWFPRKSEGMTTIQRKWNMLTGWRQWVG